MSVSEVGVEKSVYNSFRSSMSERSPSTWSMAVRNVLVLGSVCGPAATSTFDPSGRASLTALAQPSLYVTEFWPSTCVRVPGARYSSPHGFSSQPHAALTASTTRMPLEAASLIGSHTSAESSDVTMKVLYLPPEVASV